MKKLWLLLLMFTPLQLVHSQEVHHAPTVEQCRADQREWLSKLEQPGDNVAHDISVQKLDGWVGEMKDCRKIDPAFEAQYFKVAVEVGRSIFEQGLKPAPTVNECRADQKFLQSKFAIPTINNFSYDELSGWYNQMYDCQSVDSEDPRRQIEYSTRRTEASNEQLLRLQSFILRHGLWDLFMAEDAQGKRTQQDVTTRLPDSFKIPAFVQRPKRENQ